MTNTMRKISSRYFNKINELEGNEKCPIHNTWMKKMKSKVHDKDIWYHETDGKVCLGKSS